MSKKNKLINEDLSRFKLLMEYDFYIGEDKEEYSPEGDLITEEPPEEIDVKAQDSNNEPTDDAPDTDTPTDDAPGTDTPTDDVPDTDIPTDNNPEVPEGEVGDDVEFNGGPEELDAGTEDFSEEPSDDEVELDVTQLVQGTKEAKASSDEANEKIITLMDKFDELNSSLDKMDAINSKIDELENEIEKRNPTPEEKLEMRSLSSYPYNLKLTDYWSEKEGNYDVMKDEKTNDKKEYVLTQDEVDNDYNPIYVKDSFSDSNEFDDDDEFNNNMKY